MTLQPLQTHTFENFRLRWIHTPWGKHLKNTQSSLRLTKSVESCHQRYPLKPLTLRYYQHWHLLPVFADSGLQTPILCRYPRLRLPDPRPSQSHRPRKLRAVHRSIVPTARLWPMPMLQPLVQFVHPHRNAAYNPSEGWELHLVARLHPT